jgi:hypothetical protein
MRILFQDIVATLEEEEFFSDPIEDVIEEQEEEIHE